MIDERVGSLVAEFQMRLEEIQNLPSGLKIDHAHWRKRFRRLLRETFDEPSRIALLEGYACVLNLIACELEEIGHDLSFFRKFRASTWRELCLEEAIYGNEGRIICPSEFEAIVKREVMSGRMEESLYSCNTDIAAEQLKDRTYLEPYIPCMDLKPGQHDRASIGPLAREVRSLVAHDTGLHVVDSEQ